MEIPLKQKYRAKKDRGYKSAGHGAGAKKKPNSKKSSAAQRKAEQEREVKMALVLVNGRKRRLMRVEDVPWSK